MIDLTKYLNVYEFTETLPGSGQQIKVRPYSAADLKKVLLESDEEEGLDKLLNSCILTEGVAAEDLYLKDRKYLIVAVRKVTKGSTYNYTYVCPACQSQKITTVDLKKMKVKKLPKDFSNVVKLDDNISIELKPVTRRTIKESLRLIELEERDTQTVFSDTSKIMEQIMITYALSIVKIITPDGEYSPTPEESIEFINNEKLPKGLFEKIANWFESLDYGIDFDITVFCSNEKCEKHKINTTEVLPLGDFLF